MIAMLAVAWLAQQATVQGRVLDADSGLPIAGAEVSIRARITRSESDGQFFVRADAGDTVLVRRVGYQRTRVVVGDGPLVVHMRVAATVLRGMRIQDSMLIARSAATRGVSQLLEQGIANTGSAIAALPFVTARSARGESTVSLRGARAEQVLVTIDGMPLNDPATGRADVSDIPLVALGAISVQPGSASTSLGSGASGGVVALSSGDRSIMSANGSSIGGVGLEGALATSGTQGRLRVGAAASSLSNDFTFVNDAGVRDTIEKRRNADEKRVALFATGVFRSAQLTTLYSARERGLGGAKNVRAYDNARESAERRLVRVRVGSDHWVASAGVRRLALRYRDDLHSELASDAYGTTVDADVRTTVRAITLRAGASQEHVWGSNLRTADRPAGFVSAGMTHEIREYVGSFDIRADAIRDERVQFSPSVGLERRGRIRPFVRVAQGFRLPTFYDLYVPTPMGFVASGVSPERVVLDAEAGVRTSGLRGSATASVFERRTRDAVVWFPGNFTWSPQNVPKERVRGAEASAAVVAGRFSTEAWGARYDTRLYVEGLEVPTPYVAKTTGGITSRAAFGRMAITAALAARGRRPFAVAAPSRALEMPGVALVDLQLAYRLPSRSGHTLLTAGVLNVGNTTSESIRRFPSPGRIWQAAITVQP